MGIGLGVWYGKFKEKSKHGLRGYDANGNWHPTKTKEERQMRLAAGSRAEQAEQRAEEERSRADRLAHKLKELGIDPDEG